MRHVLGEGGSIEIEVTICHLTVFSKAHPLGESPSQATLVGTFTTVITPHWSVTAEVSSTSFLLLWQLQRCQSHAQSRCIPEGYLTVAVTDPELRRSLGVSV